ncbi:group I truncated hemoglobin [Flavobacterium frigoris]|uniref:Hemoglobin n=1 Tax=Flavobacterium frigoris TaxID=229204 RepID=A0A1H9RIR8_FLAFI|nr:group 1 truncated hemoglobin [Flavobacterium frigoris]SER72604.1 hemoglobin [Flavobacterium frigoris]
MTKLLYDRLGGSIGINQIVNEVVQAHMNNPAINARFLPLKEQPEHLASIKKHTVKFFSAGSGGPETYSGKDMVATHTGMNISRGEFAHGIDDILGVLENNHIDEESKKDVLAILWSLKSMVVSL